MYIIRKVIFLSQAPATNHYLCHTTIGDASCLSEGECVPSVALFSPLCSARRRPWSSRGGRGGEARGSRVMGVKEGGRVREEDGLVKDGEEEEEEG